MRRLLPVTVAVPVTVRVTVAVAGLAAVGSTTTCLLSLTAGRTASSSGWPDGRWPSVVAAMFAVLSSASMMILARRYGTDQQRMREITAALRRLNGGDLTAALGDQRQDATGELARAVDDVAGHLRALVISMQRATVSLHKKSKEILDCCGQIKMSAQLTTTEALNAMAVANEIAKTIQRYSYEAAANSDAIAGSIERVWELARDTTVAAVDVDECAGHIVFIEELLREVIAEFDVGSVEVTEVMFDVEIRTTTVSGGVVTVPNSVAGDGVCEWTYLGEWAICHGAWKFALDKNSYTSSAEASASILFHGSRVIFYGVADKNHGISYISIDGGEEIPFDLYAPTRSSVSWQSPLLSPGLHAFRVRCSLDKNPASDYNWLSVDRIEIVTESL